MNTLSMKKQSRILLFLGIMIILFGTVSYAAGPGYVITDLSTNSSTTITTGDTFKATFNIENVSGDDNTNLYLTITSSSFKPVNGIYTIDLGAYNNGDEKEVNINLEYLGGSGTFTFDLSSDEAAAESFSVAFDVRDSSGSSSTTKDSSNYKPILTIDNSDVPKFDSGQHITFEVPISNESSHTAKDIIMTFTDGLDNLPFNVKNTDLIYEIDKISGKKEAVVEVDAVLSPLVASKVHELNITLNYKNSYGDSFSSTDKIYIEVEKGEVEPILVYDQMVLQNNSEMAEGTQDILSVVFYNGGTIEARDVKIVLDGFSETGIMLNRDVDTKYSKDISGNALGYANFKIRTGSEAKSGDAELTGKVTYSDLSGTAYEKEFSLKVPVVGSDTDQVDISFEGLKGPNGIKAGDSFYVTGKIVNKGNVDLDTVDVKLNYSGEIVAKSKQTLTFRGVAPGESREVSFALLFKPNSSSEYLGIDVMADYFAKGDTEEDKESVSDYVGIEVDSESKMGRPKLIVEGYSYGEESAMAGEVITLSMDIKNTSKVERVKNIKVTMTGEEGVFTPVNSSNSFFIESIPAGEIVTKSMDFKVKADASVKNYQMTVKMEYEDSQGNAYDAQDQPFAETENLSINVAQPIRLEMGDVALPFEISVGQPFNLEMDFYNMGKSTMYNMMIKMEGNFMVQDANYFVGNFDMGRSDYYSGVLIPEAPGPIEGKILFTFEDALGNVITREKDFTSTAVEMDMPMGEDFFPPEGEYPPGIDIPEEGGGVPWYAYLIGFIVLGAGGFVFLKRRKKKKEALLMEDDDE